MSKAIFYVFFRAVLAERFAIHVFLLVLYCRERVASLIRDSLHQRQLPVLIIADSADPKQVATSFALILTTEQWRNKSVCFFVLWGRHEIVLSCAVKHTARLHYMCKCVLPFYACIYPSIHLVHHGAEIGDLPERRAQTGWLSGRLSLPLLHRAEGYVFAAQCYRRLSQVRIIKWPSFNTTSTTTATATTTTITTTTIALALQYFFCRHYSLVGNGLKWSSKQLETVVNNDAKTTTWSAARVKTCCCLCINKHVWRCSLSHFRKCTSIEFMAR